MKWITLTDPHWNGLGDRALKETGYRLQHDTAKVDVTKAGSRALADESAWTIIATIDHPFAPNCQAEFRYRKQGWNPERPQYFDGTADEARAKGEQMLRFLAGWVGMELPALIREAAQREGVKP